MLGLGREMMVSLALAVAGLTKARIMQAITAQPEAIQSFALSLITAIYNAHHATRTYLAISESTDPH
jgi:hypothetical protein